MVVVLPAASVAVAVTDLEPVVVVSSGEPFGVQAAMPEPASAQSTCTVTPESIV